MRAKQCCVLTTTESKFSASKMHLSSPSGLGCCPFSGCGSVVDDLLFNELPIVCRGSVFFFVLLCIFVSILVSQSS